MAFGGKMRLEARQGAGVGEEMRGAAAEQGGEAGPREGFRAAPEKMAARLELEPLLFQAEWHVRQVEHRRMLAAVVGAKVGEGIVGVGNHDGVGRIREPRYLVRNSSRLRNWLATIAHSATAVGGRVESAGDSPTARMALAASGSAAKWA